MSAKKANDKDNIMIDIETLGTRPGCTVLSIGAVDFDEHGVGERMFYEAICPDSCSQWGLTIEPRTVMWWLEQNEAARNMLIKTKKTPLDIVLGNFKAAFNWKGKRVWCNGASFDFPILTAAFDAVGQSAPWEYWSQTDYRTLKNIVPRDVFEAAKVEAAVAHDALADAMAQAETAGKLLAWVNRPTTSAKGAKRA